ncbi:hypothetical protein DU508_11010 [Pedobacter chinensis]|uniref:C1q domain-containing protein n=1 Tax=Pedobacter chinensis TaxID=2282421 RepID=A0A369PV34_9SPHI|nr:hypothetical protein [Pedobacter chinensis]RDC56142.1 hypothetical protein DU508_11010 [Pedobacter chinensis]
MKKQLFTYLILSMFTGVTYAQTGVGTRNPQGKLHIDGAKDNPVTGVPTASQVANDVIVTNDGFVGVGVLAPKVKLDIRSAGTQNAIGIGTTTMTASAAAAGAVRYDVVNVSVGPKIQVSDGTSWNKIYLAPQKAVVVARKIVTSSIPSGGSGTIISNWQEVRDMSDSFDPTTGVFTAPRAGTYTFLLTFNFVGVPVIDGSRVETQFYNMTTSTILARGYKTFGKSMTGTTNDGGAIATRNTQAGGSSTITLTLAEGATVVPRLYQNISASSVNLRVTTNAADPANPDAGFNNLTIIEH